MFYLQSENRIESKYLSQIANTLIYVHYESKLKYRTCRDIHGENSLFHGVSSSYSKQQLIVLFKRV